MSQLPQDPGIECRDGGYFMAGTRISLASIAYELRHGKTVFGIIEDFPAISSREKVEAVIAYIHGHPHEVDAYLEDYERRWEEARKRNPPELVEKARLYRKSKDLKPA